jgi:NADPH-dependent 2,4-dienoyl-CoA reductase/sulfur reductase-like enzyme
MKLLSELLPSSKCWIFGLLSIHTGSLVCSGFVAPKATSASHHLLNMAGKHYDLAVIGGGVVGVQAAIAAASENYGSKKVCLIDAPRESGVLMAGDEDLSLGAPTGLFGKALRDTSKRIKVSTLRGMGLREDR